MESRATFTRMQDGTAEEFALIEAAETEYASTLPARVLDAVRALETGGTQGYAISRDSSTACSRRPGPSATGGRVDYVVAALVHDIGDGLAPYSHGSYAASVLRPFVSEELCWIVSHHPLFQMFYYGPHTWAGTRTPASGSAATSGSTRRWSSASGTTRTALTRPTTGCRSSTSRPQSRRSSPASRRSPRDGGG